MKISSPSSLDFSHKNILFLKVGFVDEELKGIVLNLHIF